MDWLEFLSNFLKEWEKSSRVEILTDISWSFEGEKFDSLEDFNFAIKNAHWDRPDKWKPDEKVIRVGKVCLIYEAYAEGRHGQHQCILRADDGKTFSTLELMYKMHNHLVEALKHDSHHYFEGMRTDMIWLRFGRPPKYYVVLGS